MDKVSFLKEEIEKLLEFLKAYIDSPDYRTVFHDIYKAYCVLNDNNIESAKGHLSKAASYCYSSNGLKYYKIGQRINEILKKLENWGVDSNTKANNDFDNKPNYPPIIFLSHSRDDKPYSDAIRDFIVRLNISEKQLIYTTDDEYSIPNREHMFNHLRSNIHKNTFMIILWSEKYLNNPTCLCELGAAWVLGIETMNIFTPQFDFKDEKYLKCPPDMREEMGIKLAKCSKTRVTDLKNDIVSKFGLHVNDGLAEKTINDFMVEVARIKLEEEYSRVEKNSQKTDSYESQQETISNLSESNVKLSENVNNNNYMNIINIYKD